MTIARLIAELEGGGILLSLADSEIRYRSPKHALTAADRDDLRARRGEIIDYLRTRNAARALRAAGGVNGSLMPSVAQQMWRALPRGEEEGQPLAAEFGHAGEMPPYAPSRTR